MMNALKRIKDIRGKIEGGKLSPFLTTLAGQWLREIEAEADAIHFAARTLAVTQVICELQSAKESC